MECVLFMMTEEKQLYPYFPQFVRFDKMMSCLL